MSPEVPIAVPVTLILLAFVYLDGWYQLRIAFPNMLQTWRLGAFMGGVVILWVAVGSPLAALDHQFLTAHMVQHLLVMTVAAPLILLGAPVITLLYALPRRFAERVLGPVLRCSLVHTLGRILAHPVFCLLASTVVVIGWHIPKLFDIGLHLQRWHAIEHASFFAAGLLFWWPVVQPWPSLARWPQWSIPLYLFFATLPCDALSAFLTFCNRVVYPHYLLAHRLFDISALEDQECAGALMWVWVTFAYLIPAAVVTLRILSPRRRSLKAEVV
jgi:putative membrane protein